MIYLALGAGGIFIAILLVNFLPKIRFPRHSQKFRGAAIQAEQPCSPKSDRFYCLHLKDGNGTSRSGTIPEER